MMGGIIFKGKKERPKEENKIKTTAKKKTYITGLHGSGAAKMKAEIRRKRANRHNNVYGRVGIAKVRAGDSRKEGVARPFSFHPAVERDGELFDDGHFVNQVLAAAQLVEDEEHVADVQRDAALQVVVEVDVAAQRFPVAVESAADEVAFAVDDGRA